MPLRHHPDECLEDSSLRRQGRDATGIRQGSGERPQSPPGKVTPEDGIVALQKLKALDSGLF
ncbi:Nn.00g106360.m01.CDS01 [Neocucurbitaria sp. VM-36]